MKILFTSKYSTYTKESVGGAETSMRLMAEQLASLGHEVYYLTRGGTGFNSVQKKVSGVNVILYPYFPLSTGSKTKKAGSDLITSGYRLIHLLKKSFVKRLNNYMLNRASHNVHCKNVDIVYIYYETVIMRYFTQLRMKAGLRYKIVLRMAGLHWLSVINHNPEKKVAYKKLFNQMDSFNYISEGIKELTRNEFARNDLDVKLGNELVCDIGVNSDAMKETLSDRNEGGSKNDTYKILCISRFSSHQKRQDLLLDALRLIKSVEKMSVTFIGEGENRERFIKKIREYNLGNIVSVKNYMPQQQLWDQMKSSDLLCHPCDYEGLSKIVVESMMLGLPVLASNVLPLNGYISEGVNGFLCENNPEEWAGRIMEMRDMEERKLNNVRQTAQNYAAENFNAEKNVQLYEKHFLDLLGIR